LRVRPVAGFSNGENVTSSGDRENHARTTARGLAAVAARAARAGIAALTVGFSLASYPSARAQADTLADINRPSSTIPGCVNTWNPTDPGFSNRTCEGQAVVQSWQERATAVIIDASRDPDHADKETVLGALNTLAAAADAITSSYHPQPPLTDAFAATLAWMRLQFQGFHLPIPASLGDGFRTMAGILDNPMILRVDRNAVYDRSAAMAEALSEAVTESIDPEAQATDAAVFAAHQAAVAAAHSAENGGYNAAAAAAAIVKAAGPDHAAIADGQMRILEASVASHPNQSGYRARTDRQLATIPSGLIGLLGVCLALVLISFKHRLILFGFRSAFEGSLLFMAAATFSWLPIVILLSLGLIPAGIWPGLLWLALFGILFLGGRRFVPARLREGWLSIFAIFGAAQAPSTHGTARFSEAEDATAAGHLAPSAPTDAFTLGWLRGTGGPAGRHLADGRFRQGGHILTCAPTGAGKGIDGVIPNLLDYPGSAFVLDFKGENYAVTARARREG
jgi:hypothetical protein